MYISASNRLMNVIFRTVVILLLIGPSILPAQDSLKNPIVEPQTVILNDTVIEQVAIFHKSDTLFYMRNVKGSYPIELRAKQTNLRIAEASEMYNSFVDSLYLRSANDFIEIMLNEFMVFVVTKNEADLEGVPMDELAQQRLFQLRTSFNKEVPLTTEEWLKGIGFFTLTLLVLIGLLRLISFLFGRIEKRLSKIEQSHLDEKSNLLKYFIPGDTSNVFIAISKILRVLLIAFLLFVSVPFMFKFFPFASDIVDLFYGYIAQPITYVVTGIVNFIPSLFFIIVIAVVARYLARVVKAIMLDIEVGKLKVKNFHKDWARPTGKLVGLFIYALALVSIFPYLPGSGSSAFQGVSIFIGAIISFGSTSAVANIIAGVVITYMRPFQIGDRVRIDNITGDVVDKTILVTQLRTPKNEDVTIPNANILTSKIFNLSNPENGSIILHTTVTLGYDLPWQKANDLLLEAAAKTPFIETDPKPFVLQTSLDDFYVSYELNAHTQNAKQMPFIYSEMHKNILEVFDRDGVEILSPGYLAARDGNITTVPSNLHPDTKGPLDKIVDHLTGRNQRNIVRGPKTDESL